MIVNIAVTRKICYCWPRLAFPQQRGFGRRAQPFLPQCGKKGAYFWVLRRERLAELVCGAPGRATCPLIVKLTPNVTDINWNWRWLQEKGGADIISLINTLRGMVIDIHARQPFLGNITGRTFRAGLSGLWQSAWYTRSTWL